MNRLSSIATTAIYVSSKVAKNTLYVGSDEELEKFKTLLRRAGVETVCYADRPSEESYPEMYLG